MNPLLVLQAAKASPAMDIWEDAHTMAFLQTGQLPEHAAKTEKDCIRHRAERYARKQGQLFRTLADGTRVVPPPHELRAIVMKVHHDLGHFGVKLTHSILTPHFH